MNNLFNVPRKKNEKKHEFLKIEEERNSVREIEFENNNLPNFNHLEVINTKSLRNYLNEENKNQEELKKKIDIFPNKIEKNIPNSAILEKNIQNPSISKNCKINSKNTFFHTNFKISFWRYFKYLLKKKIRCNLNEKEKIIEWCEDEFLKQFDILNILKNINGFQKFKQIFFDEKQAKLFSFIEQSDLGAALNILPINMSLKFENYNKISFEDVFDLQEQIKNKKKLSKIDKKLLNFIAFSSK